ncbi:hypothetical protein [Microbacterium sp.]|uniref:hypothetical protein n=1 Tax=Microbacterium sp. TaxID=51671 RepID=UPI003A8EB0AA
MNAQPTARRRWPWYVLGVAVFVIVAVVGLVLFTPRGDAPVATPRPTTPSTSSTTPPAVEGVDGCLGGDARAPQTVLDAQEAAPQTPEGAVSFVAAFSRWAAQKPAAPADEVAQLDGIVSTLPDLAGDVASADQFQAAQFRVTTLNGYYRIESVTDTSVVVTLMLPLVINEAVDPTLRYMPSVEVEWTGKGWVIVDNVDTPDKTSLPTTGVAIPGGC